MTPDPSRLNPSPPGLSRIALSHFRSHKLAEICCDGRPIAIYGPNGAGKTSVLEAVSLLSPGRGLRRARAGEIARRPEALGWKIRAEIGGAEVETWSDRGASRQVRIDGKAAGQLDLGRVTRVLWLIPAMDRLWIEGADGRRRFLDRAALSLHPAHAGAALRYEKAMRDRNRLLRDQIRDPGWYSALETQMAEAGASIARHRRLTVEALAHAQTIAGSAFPVAELTLPGADGSGVEDTAELAQALADSRPRDLMAGRTLVGPHRADLEATYPAKGLDARDGSTGEQKALLISLVLANARALKAVGDAPPILLLDEVSAHLDAGRRAALYDEICGLGIQAWMTGTEAQLFAALDDRAARLRVDETGGQSTITTG